MILYFSKEQIEQKLNHIEIDDVYFKGISIETYGDGFKTVGEAIIDGETYQEFAIEFSLAEKIDGDDPADYFNASWEEYDFLF